MTTSEIFSWSPYLAIGLGVLAGFGSIRSRRLVVALFASAIFVQLVGWPVIFVALELGKEGTKWQAALGAGYLLAVLVAFPYTTIGAVMAAAVARFVCGGQSHRTPRSNCV